MTVQEEINKAVAKIEGAGIVYKLAIEQLREELEQYRALGTVEELKEAREKQVAKKMLDSGERIPFSYYCPTCNTELSDDGYQYEEKYCFECGQKLREEGGTSD